MECSKNYYSDKQSYDEVEDCFTQFKDICINCAHFKSECECDSFSEKNPIKEGENKEDEERDRKKRKFVLRTADLTHPSVPNYLQQEPFKTVFFSPPIINKTESTLDLEEHSLKARSQYEIKPESSCVIFTNVYIEARCKTSQETWKLEIIAKIGCSGWLTSPFRDRLIVKTGVLSPNYHGYIMLDVYNKTRSTITIARSSPIAVLQCSKYEYISLSNL